MTGLAVRRTLQALVVLVGVSIATFALVHLVPGDPVRLALGTRFDQGTYDALRERAGLDQPLVAQFFSWFGYAVTGDLGVSFRSGEPVTSLILERLPVTASLALASIVVALLIAVPLGTASALQSLDDAPARIVLSPVNDSGVGGTAIFTDAPGGVGVRLDVKGLPVAIQGVNIDVEVSGGDVRLRVLNVDPTRVMEIGLEGAEAALIAVDGNGLPPQPLRSWRTGPATRIDLALRAPAAGGVVRLLDYFAPAPVETR